MNCDNALSRMFTLCFFGLTLGCNSDDNKMDTEITYVFDEVYSEENHDYRSIIYPRDRPEPSGAYTVSDYWYLTGGTVRLTGTWNRRDHAYELIGEPTTLSTGYFNNYSNDGDSCLRFLMEKIGKAELELWVDYLEMDYWVESDISDPLPIGYIERNGTYRDLAAAERQKIAVRGDNWELVNVPIPIGYQWVDTIALHLVKKGSGSILLKNLEMTYCDATDDSENKPDDSCRSDDECSGISICGHSDPTGDTRNCVVPRAKYLGARCVVEDECADGICHDGVCSTCSKDEECKDGGRCIPSPKNALWDERPSPYQCNPRQGLYAEGERCFCNDDCETGFCLSEAPELHGHLLDEWGGHRFDGFDADEVPYGICASDPDSDVDAGEESDAGDAGAS